ncbi:MAG: cell division protein FtsL [Nitrospinota bacterium]
MKRLFAFLARRENEGPWFYLLSVPVLTAAAVALAWPRLDVLRLRYEFRSLRAQQEKLLRQNRRLRLERATLRSLTRIEEIARRDLGLTEPSKGQVLWVKAPRPGKTSGGGR